MKRRAIATLCAISTVAIAAPVSQNEIVNRYSDLHRFSGVVLEAKNGNITYQGARGFANLEFQIPNTLRTKFNLGSMAKQFVAAAILKLDQEGKLSVKDPIQKYISEYPSPQGQQVTIHQLLCHSSGIPSIGRRDGLADGLSLDVTLRHTTKKPVEPGLEETLKIAVQTINYKADCPCVHALDSVPLDRSHRADTGGW